LFQTISYFNESTKIRLLIQSNDRSGKYVYLK
jgi:hypothetical protein